MSHQDLVSISSQQLVVSSYKRRINSGALRGHDEGTLTKLSLCLSVAIFDSSVCISNQR